MIKQNHKRRRPHLRIWSFISVLLLFLGLSGCGCLLPDVPYVPGVCQGFNRGFKK